MGQELNIVKREIIERPLPRLIERAFEVIGMHVREYSRLGQDGVFHTIPDYPPFAWQEAIVNAVAHRDYSILQLYCGLEEHADRGRDARCGAE